MLQFAVEELEDNVENEDMDSGEEHLENSESKKKKKKKRKSKKRSRSGIASSSTSRTPESRGRSGSRYCDVPVPLVFGVLLGVE